MDLRVLNYLRAKTSRASNLKFNILEPSKPPGMGHVFPARKIISAEWCGQTSALLEQDAEWSPVAKDDESVEQLMTGYTGHTGLLDSTAHLVRPLPAQTAANQHLPPGDRSQLRPVIPVDSCLHVSNGS